MLTQFTALAPAAVLASAVTGAASAAPSTQVHVHTPVPAGFGTNSVWIDDGQEVTVVDGQFTPDLSRAVVADIGLQQLPGVAQGHAQARLFAGRGPVLPVPQTVQIQLDDLNRAESAVTAEEVALGARRTDRYDAAKQAPSVARIQGALAQDLPDYAVPDLVGYSLYGWLATRGR